MFYAPPIRSLARRRFCATVFLIVTLAVPVLFSSAQARTSSKGQSNMAFTVRTADFAHGANIPQTFTCDGEDRSPALEWNGAPAGTKAFALIADDPDAPVGTWVHWVIYNIPAGAHSLTGGVEKKEQLADGARQGWNDFRKIGYNGPCPPPGKAHRYFFKLYALSAQLTLAPGATKAEVERAMGGHILGQAEWMGKYERGGK